MSAGDQTGLAAGRRRGWRRPPATSPASKVSGRAPYFSTLARSVASDWVKLPVICALPPRIGPLFRPGAETTSPSSTMANRFCGSLQRGQPSGHVAELLLAVAGEVQVDLPAAGGMPWLFVARPAEADFTSVPSTSAGPRRYFSLPSSRQVTSGFLGLSGAGVRSSWRTFSGFEQSSCGELLLQVLGGGVRRRVPPGLRRREWRLAVGEGVVGAAPCGRARGHDAVVGARRRRRARSCRSASRRSTCRWPSGLGVAVCCGSGDAGSRGQDRAEPQLGGLLHGGEDVLVLLAGDRDDDVLAGSGHLGLRDTEAVDPVADDRDRLVERLLGHLAGPVGLPRRQDDAGAALEVEPEPWLVLLRRGQ